MNWVQVVLPINKSSTSSLVCCFGPQPRLDFNEARQAPGALSPGRLLHIFGG